MLVLLAALLTEPPLPQAGATRAEIAAAFRRFDGAEPDPLTVAKAWLDWQDPEALGLAGFERVRRDPALRAELDRAANGHGVAAALAGEPLWRRWLMAPGACGVDIPEILRTPRERRLEPDAAPALTLRVYDEATGKPLAGAYVEEVDWTGLARGVTPADGELAFDEGYSLRALLVHAEGYGVRIVAAERKLAVCGVMLAPLRRETPIVGAVVDADGRPLADAEATVSLTMFDEEIDSNYLRIERCLTARTDAAGRFAIRGYSPTAERPYGGRKAGPTLTVRGRGRLPARLELPLRQDGPPIDAGTVALRPAARLAGQVLDHEGKPLGNAEVQALSGNGSAVAWTDTDGRFVLEAAAFDTTGTLFVEHRRTGPAWFPMPDARAVPVLRVPKPGFVRGRLTYFDGKPRPGASVLASRTTASQEWHASGFAKVAADGSFECGPLPVGVWFSFRASSETGYRHGQGRVGDDVRLSVPAQPDLKPPPHDP